MKKVLFIFCYYEKILPFLLLIPSNSTMKKNSKIGIKDLSNFNVNEEL